MNAIPNTCFAAVKSNASSRGSSIGRRRGETAPRVDRRPATAADPFLMLDEFRRTTRTIIWPAFRITRIGASRRDLHAAGRMRHRDTRVTRLADRRRRAVDDRRARSVHSELPRGRRLMHGFQLWVNLAGAGQVTAPAYRDIPAEAIQLYRRQRGHGQGDRGESDGVAGRWQREATRRCIWTSNCRRVRRTRSRSRRDITLRLCLSGIG